MKQFNRVGMLGLMSLCFCGLALANTVNLNTADAKSLTTLKGIGDKRAEAIVAYRKQHGAFKTMDDLMGVKGMTKKRLTKLEVDNKGAISLKGK